MELNDIAEAVDRLTSADISGRGILRYLYDAARAAVGQPLSLAAAAVLRKAAREPGTVIIVSTGATCQRMGIDPAIGEMDGPPGAVVLARAIGKGLRGVPLLLTEAGQVEPLQRVALAAGLTTASLDGATAQARSSAYNTAVVVEAFPDEDKTAKLAAAELLTRVKPGAVVTIERAGMNDIGVYHNSSGRDSSLKKARVDYLVQAATREGIPTIGVGDGGNEIGMGLIADTIREHTKYGRVCQCPCGHGLAPVTATDVLVVAAVSNWGAYAIATMLAILLDDPSLLHTPAMEERILRAAADTGYLDSSGYTDWAVDGMSGEAHVALVQLLRTVVEQPFARLLNIGMGGGVGVRGKAAHSGSTLT